MVVGWYSRQYYSGYDRGNFLSLKFISLATWVNAFSAHSIIFARYFWKLMLWLARIQSACITPAAIKNSNLPEPPFSGRRLHFFGTHNEI